MKVDLSFEEINLLIVAMNAMRVTIPMSESEIATGCAVLEKLSLQRMDACRTDSAEGKVDDYLTRLERIMERAERVMAQQPAWVKRVEDHAVAERELDRNRNYASEWDVH